MKGTIRSYGKKALTIQSSDKHQYYAPFENVEKLIIPFLDEPSKYPIHVIFEIDYSQYSGEIRGKKRFYAKEIKIDDSIII
jgi:phage terminase large subunit-like protein